MRAGFCLELLKDASGPLLSGGTYPGNEIQRSRVISPHNVRAPDPHDIRAYSPHNTRVLGRLLLSRPTVQKSGITSSVLPTF